MAEVKIVLSDQDQMRVHGIVIDQDKEEALVFLVQLLDRIREHPGHACGPKVV